MTRKMLFGCFQNTLISFSVGRISWNFLAVVSKFRLTFFSLLSALCLIWNNDRHRHQKEVRSFQYTICTIFNVDTFPLYCPVDFAPLLWLWYHNKYIPTLDGFHLWAWTAMLIPGGKETNMQISILEAIRVHAFRHSSWLKPSHIIHHRKGGAMDFFFFSKAPAIIIFHFGHIIFDCVSRTKLSSNTLKGANHVWLSGHRLL